MSVYPIDKLTSLCFLRLYMICHFVAKRQRNILFCFVIFCNDGKNIIVSLLV